MSRGCPECGAALAEDQRYCVICGAGLKPRVRRETAAPPTVDTGDGASPGAKRTPGPPRVLTLHFRGRSGVVRLPGRRLSGVLAASVLACGVLIGVAVGPVALGTGAADAARRILALVGGPPAGPQTASTTSGTTSTSDSVPGGAGSLLSGPSSAPANATPAAVAAVPASPSPAAITSTSTTSTSSRTTPVPGRLDAAGLVIADDSASQSFDVVDAKHRLVEVHSSTLPAVGTRVKYARASLPNGTASASRIVAVRAARPATVTADGVVSYVSAANASYVLSAPGVSLPIEPAASPLPNAPAGDTAPDTDDSGATNPAPPRTVKGMLSGLTNSIRAAPLMPPFAPGAPPATAAAPLPSVGQRLRVVISLPVAGATGAAATTLREVSRTALGQASRPVDIAGIITTLDPQERIATISADGPGLSSDTIPLAVPKSIQLQGVHTPATVVARVSVTEGLYTLTGMAPDDSASDAADRRKYLGDYRGG